MSRVCRVLPFSSAGCGFHPVSRRRRPPLWKLNPSERCASTDDDEKEISPSGGSITPLFLPFLFGGNGDCVSRRMSFLPFSRHRDGALFFGRPLGPPRFPPFQCCSIKFPPPILLGYRLSFPISWRHPSTFQQFVRIFPPEGAATLALLGRKLERFLLTVRYHVSALPEPGVCLSTAKLNAGCPPFPPTGATSVGSPFLFFCSEELGRSSFVLPKAFHLLERCSEEL